MRFRNLLFFLAISTLLGTSAQAQVRVELSIKRHLFIIYEPILATVSVTNLSGRDLVLKDADGQQWFGFGIVSGDERLVPPLDPNYHLDPLSIPAGATVKRSVNLASLYSIREFGLYRVKATIYCSDVQRYFSSSLDNIELTEGKTVWQQTVGVPEGIQGAGQYRTFSLLTHRGLRDNMLYARIEDKDAGVVYATHPIGRLLQGNEPQVELDQKNMLHVFQVIGPKTYIYTKIGLNGEWLGQASYMELKNRPHLKKLPDGTVGVAGGQMDVRVAEAINGPVRPKLSDRPAGMPK